MNKILNKTSLNAGFLTSDELSEFGIFDATERNIRIHSTAVIVNMNNIHFGENIRIDPNVVISCSDLKLASNIHIATGCGIFGTAKISIGEFTSISGHCLIYSSSDDYSGKALSSGTVPNEFTCVYHGNVSIGRHALLGARCTVLPGAKIGEGAAVGSSSLISSDLPPWTISVGTPAKPIKERSQECLKSELDYIKWKEAHDV